MVGRTNLLAVREALHRTHTLGSPIQGRFKVAVGLEVSLQIKKQEVSCVMLARDQIGWRYLLASLTRPAGWTGEVQLELDKLRAAKGHVILLVRPEGAGRNRRVLKAIAKAMQVMVSPKQKKAKRGRMLVKGKRTVLVAKIPPVGKLIRLRAERTAQRGIKKRVPTTYLALPGRNRVLEKLGIDTGLTPVAAPDIHCTRLGQETLMADWRAIRRLTKLNPQRCMTLSSCDAVVQRFAGGRKLLARSADILAVIDDFDFFVPADSDSKAIRQVAKLATVGANRKVAPDAHSEAYQVRLQDELSIIVGAGMERQFAAAATLHHKFRSVGVPLERHQGHLASSLVAYSLSLTAIDPIREGLVFRNFLRPWVVRRPSMDLMVGSGAKPILEAHLSKDYLTLDRPLQVIHLDVEACAERVGDCYGLNASDRKTLHAALQKARPKGGTAHASVHVTIPKARGLQRAIAITPVLAKLPWQVQPHPTELLVNTWRTASMGCRIAPVAGKDASAFGYLPLCIVTDPNQDALKQQRRALTVDQQEAVLKAIHARDDPKALTLAIDMWSRDKRLIPTVYRIQNLMLGPDPPSTFDDLVTLHGFLQGEEVDWNALLAHFKLERRDSKYWFFKHPILKPIMAGTRGQILWDEQCFRLMVEALRLKENQAHAFLEMAARDPQHGAERWQYYASTIKKSAHVPRNLPVPKGSVLNVNYARSSQRRVMYGRNQIVGRVPMSSVEVNALHVMIGEALGRTRSKALALAAALRGYEQALLQLAHK